MAAKGSAKTIRLSLSREHRSAAIKRAPSRVCEQTRPVFYAPPSRCSFSAASDNAELFSRVGAGWAESIPAGCSPPKTDILRRRDENWIVSALYPSPKTGLLGRSLLAGAGAKPGSEKAGLSPHETCVLRRRLLGRPVSGRCGPRRSRAPVGRPLRP